MKCPKCGAQIPEDSMFCSKCGAIIEQTEQMNDVDTYVEYTLKDPVVAALLAIFFGDIGLHWFYVGKIKRGILSVLFWWTMIPGIIGIVKGIQWLVNGDEYFHRDITQ